AAGQDRAADLGLLVQVAGQAEAGVGVQSQALLHRGADQRRVGQPRYLNEEAEVGGAVLPRGTTVVCSMAAANRDEDAFGDAAEMDLTRSPNQHLAFGSGSHSCLGQALARTELQVVLEVLLRRLPALELAVPAAELERVEGLAVGGLRTVPVRW
ncbi:cytochrome P450, partial [Streptosporangium sandarakinum]